MTLSELRYVVAVARERHFGRAAEACFVTQPTLSVAVKKLEDELGVVLFERGKTRIGLTEAGERVVAQARLVLEQVERLKQIAARGRDELASPLRLGAIYTIGPYLLPRLIPLMHRRAPGMPLYIQEDYTAALRTQLKRGELDAIIISLPFADPGVAVEPLYEEPFVAVAPAAHPWARRKRVRAEELAAQTLLLLGPGHCFRDQVMELCPECARRAGESAGAQRALQGSSLETIRHMVASGAGVTVLPCTAARGPAGEHRLLAVRPFVGPVPRRRVALAWRRSFPRPRAVAAVAEAIRASGLDCVRYLSGGRD